MTKSTSYKHCNPFHLAMPVDNLDQAREFYGTILQCEQGRSCSHWIDFDFFGHQFVAHKVDKSLLNTQPENEVDGLQVPVPHFGVVLDWDHWQQLAARLKSLNINFIIDPYIRFAGKTGEQATMFFKDPAGNSLEFKAFKDPEQLFAK